MDRQIIRGGLYALISLSLACYEALTHDPIRFELIIGYGLVFLFGVFTIVSRKNRQDHPVTAEKESDQY